MKYHKDQWFEVDQVDALIDTGSTHVDVVSEKYCEIFEHEILPLPPKHQRDYIGANGRPIITPGVAKIHVGWTGSTGSINILREFLVVRDLPRNLMFGNRTIMRYNMLDSAGFMLPLTLAARSSRAKVNDKARTAQATIAAKLLEAEKAAQRTQEWVRLRQQGQNTQPAHPASISDGSPSLIGGSDTSVGQASASVSGPESSRPSTDT